MSMATVKITLRRCHRYWIFDNKISWMKRQIAAAKVMRTTKAKVNPQCIVFMCGIKKDLFVADLI